MVLFQSKYGLKGSQLPSSRHAIQWRNREEGKKTTSYVSIP